MTTVLPDFSCETVSFDHDINIRLLSYRNVTVNHDGLIHSGFKFANIDQVTKDRIKKRYPSISTIFSKAQFSNRETIHLLGKNAGSYGHFIFEQFPRLLRYRELFGRRLDNVVILVKPECASWVSKILDNFDLGSPQIHPIRNSIKVDKLIYLPPPQNNAKVFDRMDGKRCRGLLKFDGLKLEAMPTKIFLSRSNAGKRVLLNETELLSCTKEVYPDIVELDLANISFEHELALALQSELIVGAAGQNFSLGPFLGNGVTAWVLAKRDPRPFNWASRFALMASIYGGRGFVSFPTFDWPDFHDNWVYDPEVFVKQASVISNLVHQDGL